MGFEDGGDAFALIRPGVFRIERRLPTGVQIGTGFRFARGQPSGDVILATAGHLLDSTDVEEEWTVYRYDVDGNVDRRLTVSGLLCKGGKPRYGRHKWIDIGYLRIPGTDQHGNSMAEGAVPLIDVNLRIVEGSRVAWAGFSAHVGSFLGRPAVCCFEGVVSAFNGHTDNPCYIVDGHNACGVSGGPVWSWGDDGNVHIVGVVVGYSSLKNDAGQLPGFCVFTPINVLLSFFLAHGAKEEPMLRADTAPGQG